MNTIGEISGVQPNTFNSGQKKENQVLNTLMLILTIALGVIVKLVSDKIIYKIESSIGSRLNPLIFSPKRYGSEAMLPNTMQNTGTHGGYSTSGPSQGSLFGNPDPWGRGNPFR